MAGLVVKVQDDNHFGGTFGPVVLLVWGRETTHEGVEAFARLAHEVGELCPGGVLCLTVVKEDSKPPPGDVRASLAHVLKGLGFVKRSAVVFEGKGFVSAMVRGVVTGLQLLQRIPYPHQIFDTSASAIAWLVSGSLAGSSTPSGLELVEALNDLRARFDRQLARAR